MAWIIILGGKKLKNIRLPVKFVVCSPTLTPMKYTAGHIEGGEYFQKVIIGIYRSVLISKLEGAFRWKALR
jgi:hypothetical protein